MNLDLNCMGAQELDAAAKHYEEHGYVVLSGLQEKVVPEFRRVFEHLIGVDDRELSKILDPANPEQVFPSEIRQRVGKIDTPADLSQALVKILQPILVRLIGPFTQVSNTFHGQFKGGAPQEVDYGGYSSDYMEVHRPYLLHQDFTGASLPTSPSAVTLWVSMNSCPDWTVRFYPGSHHQGLLCNDFLKLDDERLSALGAPIDITSREGTGVLFNALMLHGTSNPGSQRRVSCDIRFFPLCPFLPSEVRWLTSSPIEVLENAIKGAYGPALLSPLLETKVFLGQDLSLQDIPSLSVLNWVNYLACVMRGQSDEALSHLERFTNTQIGYDSPAVYVSKFHGRPMQELTLRQLRDRLMPDLCPPELSDFEQLTYRDANV